MNRIANVNQAGLEAVRTQVRENYEQYNPPCPPSYLKVDDHVQWLGFVDAVIVWGHDDPSYFFAYAPDVFGEAAIPLDVGYINDRAPADPEEEPLPIYPAPEGPQQLAQQPGARDAVKPKRGGKTPDAAEAKRVLQKLLQSLPPESAKKAREYIRTHKPELQLPEGA